MAAIINIGPKSSISSATIYSVANSLSIIKTDPLLLINSTFSDQISNSVTNTNSLNLEELRASLFLSLKNSPFSLLKLNNNNDFNSLQLLGTDLTSSTILVAIGGLIEYKATTLSLIVDSICALSIEACGGSDEFNESVTKDEISVTNDLKLLLNGSKLVNKSKDLRFFIEIPQILGKFREIVRLVRLSIKSLLNCANDVSGSSLASSFLSLSQDLRVLGEGSLLRSKRNVENVKNEGLKEVLLNLFEKECVKVDDIVSLFKNSIQACFEQDYVKFLHEVNGLVDCVKGVVYWEAITAFVSLESGEFVPKKGSEIVPKDIGNGDNAKMGKRSEKKKKVVLGKGNSVLVEYLKNILKIVGNNEGNLSTVLEKCAKDLMWLLDPKNEGFSMYAEKVKEIVESNENRRLPKLPKGTRDFAKEQMTIRERAFSIITSVFKRHGATALDTPAFELRETLTGKYGEDSKLIYDLADQGGELCSLRYDLTVPFARYVAMNGITSFKRYQIAKVYRRDNPSKGRYREFYQCDFDVAGQYETMGPDFEVIKVMTELLDELDIGDYEVKLNHRKLLDGMLDICGVPPEKFRTICSSIDKLDKLSFEQIKKEMVEEKGLSGDTADLIGTFVKERGPPMEVLTRLKLQGSKFLENEGSRAALDELEILFKALEASNCSRRIVFDLSLARGLDYYTGVIYEAVFKGATQVGSIAAGGRYDNLIGMFGTKQVPAVGVSLGIERVFTIMEQNYKDQNQVARATETQVLVSILGDDLTLAAKIVSELWAAGIKAEFMVNKRVMKHIDRAKASRIPFVVILGEHELNEGVVNLKDVEASVDERIPRDRLVEELQKRINGI